MPNDIEKIIIAVKHGKLIKVKDAFPVEGSLNALKCAFEFRTKDWDNTEKFAAFVPYRATNSISDSEKVYIPLDENNECDIPFEILENSEYFSVGVFGTSQSYRIVSNWMCYRNNDGCYADGSTALDHESTAYDQILKMIKSKSDIEHNHDEAYYTKNELQSILNLTDEEIGILDAGSIKES